MRCEIRQEMKPYFNWIDYYLNLNTCVHIDTHSRRTNPSGLIWYLTVQYLEIVLATLPLGKNVSLISDFCEDSFP